MKKLLFLIFSAFVLFSFKSSETVEIKWDFSKYKKLTYEYQQTVKSEIEPLKKDTMVILGKGSLELNVQNPNLANFTINMDSLISFELDSLGNKSNYDDEYPPFSLNLAETGENAMNSPKGTSEEFLINILFPLVKDNISLNSETEIPLIAYSNNNGKLVAHEGKGLVNLSKKDEFYNLVLNYDSSNAMINEEFDIEGDKIKAESQTEYDLENRVFVKGYGVMIMAFYMNGKEISSKHEVNYKLISIE